MSLGTPLGWADVLPAAILFVDPRGQVRGANRAARALMAASSLEGELLTNLAADEPRHVEALLARCGRSRTLLPGSLTLRGIEAKEIPCRVQGALVEPADETRPGLIFLSIEPRGKGDSARRFAVLNQKINDLASEVNRRRRAEALLESQKSALASIAAGEPLSSALETLATHAERHCPGMLASILLLDGRTLRHAASPSLAPTYREAIDGVEIGPCVGSCGTAAFTGERVIVNDIATDPLWRDFRELAANHSLGACWSVPILGEERQVLGTFALYYRKPRVPAEEEIELIENFAHVARIAIERHRAVQDREQLFLAAEQARAAAERANRDKDHFLAMLGHELRNPVGAITNAARVLEGDSDGNEHRSTLCGVILRQSDNLRRILEDLLDVARIDTDKLIIQRRSLDLGELTEHCVTYFTDRARARSQHLQVDTAHVFVEGDATRLEQVLSNLIDNAIKYTPEGGTISIEAEAADDEAVVRVCDTGVGMDEDLLAHIFDPFMQAPQSLERSGGGLGLGLALVKRLVELHGGTVFARSEGAGRGSEFELRLPRHDPVDSVANDAAPSTATTTDERRCVALVEDNQDARVALRMLLEMWGHQVHDAPDGREGIRCITENPVDLALIDLGLPEVDGYGVARAIRERMADRGIVLVALTGYGQPDDRSRVLEAGFDVHLVKPVTPEALREVLALSRPA